MTVTVIISFILEHSDALYISIFVFIFVLCFLFLFVPRHTDVIVSSIYVTSLHTCQLLYSTANNYLHDRHMFIQ